MSDEQTAEWREIAAEPNDIAELAHALCEAADEVDRLRSHNVITYTLASEPGTSLVAAGWVRDAEVVGRSWDTPSRRRTDQHPTEDKVRWRAARLPSPTPSGES